MRADRAADATDPGNVSRVHVRHRGRMTAAQARALATLADRYVLPWSAVTDAHFPAGAFGRAAPLAVEVGFGNGNALVAFAAAHEHWNCVGVDVYQPGFGALLLACEREAVANVRAVNAEAITFLQHLAPASVRLINVFFPDPWPKKRHHKRRVVNPAFAAAAAACLEPGGTLALATDDADYATHMATVLNAADALQGGVAATTQDRPHTPFETKARAAGRPVAELAYRRMR